MEKLITVVKSLTLIFAIIACSLSGLRTYKPEKYYTDDEIASFTEASRAASEKGMIIAVGGGFDTEKNYRPLAERAIAHTGKEQPNFLFLPTAHFDRLEDPEEMVEWFTNAGCVCDTLLVSTADEQEIASKIARADIIYETGGNLQYLAQTWGAKGVFGLMKQAFDRGAVLMGVSSGAMCWAERGWDDFGPETLRIIGSFPFVGSAGAYEFCDAAGILPFCVCPHFDNLGWRSFSLQAKELDIPSLAIENGAAVVFSAGSYEVVADAATPLRTAYLFVPEEGISFANLRLSPELAAVVDGQRRLG